jgi:hypothetical protein
MILCHAHNGGDPFLAGTNMPSIKHLAKSI